MTKAANRRLFFFSGGLRARRLAGIIAWINSLRAMRRGRRELAQMNDRMLADIGLSRTDARTEASRKFWDLK